MDERMRGLHSTTVWTRREMEEVEAFLKAGHATMCCGALEIGICSVRTSPDSCYVFLPPMLNSVQVKYCSSRYCSLQIKWQLK
ncbi:hypothetical protein Mapa_009536 [Marchantia paleacea]|nr:hypothetical protein Mapa_009536 [Marchantia paleacea]